MCGCMCKEEPREQESVRERARGNGCTVTQQRNHGTTQPQKHALTRARMHRRIDRERCTYRERVRRTNTQAHACAYCTHKHASLLPFQAWGSYLAWKGGARLHRTYRSRMTSQRNCVPLSIRGLGILSSAKKNQIKTPKKDTKKCTKIYRTHTHALSHTHTSRHITPQHN